MKLKKRIKKRNNTIKAVNKFDASLLTEYAVTETQEIYLITQMGTIMQSSSKGGKISPMYFDSKAYKNSDVYKQMDDVKKANSDYLTFKKDQAKARKQAKELEEQENRPWYEKAWDTTKTFTGEITGYYDYIRATEGVDPRTHAKLTTAQRTAAGAMALAGFIPIVGWAGRAAKGGVAIYRTAKVLNAADHALDAYKTTKGFAALQKTEKGIYALAAANGMGEGITGRDFLGNKLTEEQKQQSLIQAFSILGLGAASKFIGGKPANIPFNTYSKQYAQATAKNAQNTIREIGKQIGKVDVPVGAKVLKMAGNGPIQPKVLAIETKTLSEVKQGLGEKLAKKQKQVNKELSGGSEGRGTHLSKTEVGKADLNVLRQKLNVPETHTIAVGKTDISGLEEKIFEGSSIKVRREAGLPDLDDIMPNREIRAPYDGSNPRHIQFMKHAEEGVINEFDMAIKKLGVNPNEVEGTLVVHQSNPRGVCSICTQGMTNPNKEAGIFMQLTKKYPNLTIKVTTEVKDGIRVSGKENFILLNGKLVE
ncbi:pre-toxin TG domain-containing protein [Peribacillus sp. B-H-3]|uniref:pre-toxin TG domain-containing protein n=1 Tax=Peribacillus sp. B-H-3 TaxID=3400420 RepID=UPI003B01D510